MDLSAQMNQGMSFGMMNALRTGSPILDVLLCMLIPVILGFFLGPSKGDPLSKQLTETVRDISDWMTGTKTYVRTIAHESRQSYYHDNSALDTAERNNILQKAVKLFIQDNCKLDLGEAEVYLLPTREVKLDADRWGDRCVFSGSYKQLMSYQVMRLPRKDYWVVVEKGDPPVMFRQQLLVTEESEGQSRTAIRTLIFEVQARGPGAAERVDSFVDRAFEYYKKKKGEEVDDSRFFYQPMLKGVKADKEGEEGGGEETRTYKRYLLSDSKGFNTLFFPEKEALLKLVDDFRDCKGKFSIPGFPNKLGLLLDGPPGTGKTSLIKALAIYLHRHIVSVSLEKIRTNQELMDMMFDLAFKVAGEDEPIKMKFNEVIFVMEDVDCASDVVYARKQGPGAQGADMVQPVPQAFAKGPATSEVPKEPLVLAPPKATLARSLTMPADPAGYRRSTPFSTAKMLRKLSFREKQGVTSIDESDEDEEEDVAPAEASAPASKAPPDAPAEAPPPEAEPEEEEEEREEKAAKPAKPASKKDSLLLDAMLPNLDKLNLSGLLNVLDGVVDTPGRVLIMTTNHPEKLDPALIRPGRINKRLHLGYVSASTLLQMATHYVCRSSGLPPNAHKEAEALCNSGRGITPAWVEQCSAEADDFDGLVKNLWILKNAAAPGSALTTAVTAGAPRRW